MPGFRQTNKIRAASRIRSIIANDFSRNAESKITNLRSSSTRVFLASWSSRLGIDQVIEGIKTQKWDLILAEDVSRLYRHETACGKLFELAVDEGLRIICCNEFLDTNRKIGLIGFASLCGTMQRPTTIRPIASSENTTRFGKWRRDRTIKVRLFSQTVPTSDRTPPS